MLKINIKETQLIEHKFHKRYSSVFTAKFE